MGDYVLVESRDPFESGDAPYFFKLAGDLAARGEKVTLFLVQNAVLAVRKGAKENSIAAAIDRGVEVMADSFSLRERGVLATERRAGVRLAEIGDLVDQMMADGVPKVLWH